MSARSRSLWVGLSLVLVACNRRPVTQLSTAPDVNALRWNATLATPEAMRTVVQARGTASVSRVDDGRRSRVEIQIANLVPGGEYAWALHVGQCGSAGAEVYRSEDGRRLKIDGDGKSAANATIDVPFPTTGDYLVRVTTPASQSPQVIACGNLAPPTIRPGF